MKSGPCLTWSLLVGLFLLTSNSEAARATSLILGKSKPEPKTDTPPTDEEGESTTFPWSSSQLGNESNSGSNVTPKLTGIPQIDYIYDPNLPRELNGYNLTDYPFYNSIPEDIDFKCDGLHDGFYASIPHKCQVYHHCLFGTRYDFLCANYTAFDQKNFICHFASEVDCKNSPKYFKRNEALYKAQSTTLAPVAVPSSLTSPRRQQDAQGGKRRRPYRRRKPTYDYYDDYDDSAEQDDYDDGPQGKKRKKPRPHNGDDFEPEEERPEEEEKPLPAAPNKSVFDRPRIAPKIRRPVPVNERDKYDYGSDSRAIVAKEPVIEKIEKTRYENRESENNSRKSNHRDYYESASQGSLMSKDSYDERPADREKNHSRGDYDSDWERNRERDRNREHDSDRERERERSREYESDRERDRERGREHDSDRERERSREYESDRERDRKRGREHDSDRERERSREYESDRERDRERDREHASDRERERERNREPQRDRDRDRDRTREHEGGRDRERERDRIREYDSDRDRDRDKDRPRERDRDLDRPYRRPPKKRRRPDNSEEDDYDYEEVRRYRNRNRPRDDEYYDDDYDYDERPYRTRNRDSESRSREHDYDRDKGYRGRDFDYDRPRNRDRNRSRDSLKSRESDDKPSRSREEDRPVRSRDEDGPHRFRDEDDYESRSEDWRQSEYDGRAKNKSSYRSESNNEKNSRNGDSSGDRSYYSESESKKSFVKDNYEGEMGPESALNVELIKTGKNKYSSRLQMEKPRNQDGPRNRDSAQDSERITERPYRIRNTTERFSRIRSPIMETITEETKELERVEERDKVVLRFGNARPRTPEGSEGPQSRYRPGAVQKAKSSTAEDDKDEERRPPIKQETARPDIQGEKTTRKPIGTKRLYSSRPKTSTEGSTSKPRRNPPEESIQPIALDAEPERSRTDVRTMAEEKPNLEEENPEDTPIFKVPFDDPSSEELAPLAPKRSKPRRRPFLPSRGGSSTLPRGLQPVGVKAVRVKIDKKEDEEPTTERPPIEFRTKLTAAIGVDEAKLGPTLYEPTRIQPEVHYSDQMHYNNDYYDDYRPQRDSYSSQTETSKQSNFRNSYAEVDGSHTRNDPTYVRQLVNNQREVNQQLGPQTFYSDNFKFKTTVTVTDHFLHEPTESTLGYQTATLIPVYHFEQRPRDDYVLSKVNDNNRPLIVKFPPPEKENLDDTDEYDVSLNDALQPISTLHPRNAPTGDFLSSHQRVQGFKRRNHRQSPEDFPQERPQARKRLRIVTRSVPLYSIQMQDEGAIDQQQRFARPPRVKYSIQPSHFIPIFY